MQSDRGEGLKDEFIICYWFYILPLVALSQAREKCPLPRTVFTSAVTRGKKTPFSGNIFLRRKKKKT